MNIEIIDDKSFYVGDEIKAEDFNVDYILENGMILNDFISNGGSADFVNLTETPKIAVSGQFVLGDN